MAGPLYNSHSIPQLQGDENNISYLLL